MALRIAEQQALKNLPLAALPPVDGSQTLGLRGELQWIPANSIGVDPRYQRPISKGHVEQIIKHFDPDLLGVFLVSERDDGSRYILDGQHRLEAIIRKGFGDAVIPAMIYRGLTEEREAHIFADLNRRRQVVNPSYAFRARLMAKDPMALKIKETVERYGFHINYLKALPEFGERTGDLWKPEGRLYAVGEMEKLLSSYSDPQMLENVLGVMRDAWTSEAIELKAQHLRGIAMFLFSYGEHERFDRKRLIIQLEKSSPTRLLQDARDKAGGGTVSPSTIALTILDRYNYGLSWKHKLPRQGLRKAHAQSATSYGMR